MHSGTSQLQNQAMSIEIPGSADCLWRYRVAHTDQTYDIAAPAFEIDGAEHSAALSEIRPTAAPERLANGCTEYHFAGRLLSLPDLELHLVFRAGRDSPIVRFRYSLAGAGAQQLTKAAGYDRLTYLTVPLAEMPPL